MVAVGDHGGDPPRRWPDDLRGPYDAHEARPVPCGAPTTDLRHGIRALATAAVETAVYILLTETTLRDVRGADHQDGHPTTDQNTLSEEVPRDHLAEALLDLRADGPVVTLDGGL